MTATTIAAIAPTLIAAGIGTVLIVGTILLTIHHWLTLRRQLVLQRARHTRPQRSSGYSVDIWRQRAQLAEARIEELTREVWLARRTSDDLAHQLSAARTLGRRQERDRLAITTLVVEANQTGQWPAIDALSPPPTRTVTPLNRRHRVLRSA
jgi:hypothetical protein